MFLSLPAYSLKQCCQWYAIEESTMFLSLSAYSLVQCCRWKFSEKRTTFLSLYAASLVPSCRWNVNEKRTTFLSLCAAALFRKLESKERGAEYLGISHFAISMTTLDQVFYKMGMLCRLPLHYCVLFSHAGWICTWNLNGVCVWGGGGCEHVRCVWLHTCGCEETDRCTVRDRVWWAVLFS